MNAAPDEAERRNARPSLLTLALVGVASTIALLYFIATLVAHALDPSTWWLFAHHFDDSSKWFEVARSTVAFAGGLGLGVALIIAYRRQELAEWRERFEADVETYRRASELYSSAIDQLGHESPTVRLAAMYTLDRLGSAHAEFRQNVVDVWCAYLRAPRATAGPTRQNFAQENEVRHAAQRLLLERLRGESATAWIGDRDNRVALDVDLSGAQLDRFDCTGRWFTGTARFDEAKFSGTAQFQESQFFSTPEFQNASFDGSLSFEDVKFLGGAEFQNAKFKRVTKFSGASFSRSAIFDRANFSSSAIFHAVRFDESASFGGSSFSENTEFEETAFGGNAWFIAAEFAGSSSFSEANFAGVAVFREAKFSGVASFKATKFGGTAKFEESEFLESARFDNAVFSEGILFQLARVTGATAFTCAKVHGVARFDHAVFSGGLWVEDAKFEKDAVLTSSSFADATAMSAVVDKTRRTIELPAG